MKTVMVTAVGAPPGLTTAKILSEEYRVIAVDADRYACGLYVPGVVPYLVPVADADGYVDRLVEICVQEKVDVLVSCYETETLVISAQRQRFAELGVRILLADHDIVLKCIDKYETAKQAERAGVPCPKTLLLTDTECIAKADISYPAVLKPVVGSGGVGVSYPGNREEAMESYRRLNRRSILQELIPGGAGSVYLVACLYDRQSQLKASFVSRSLKTLNKDGGPAVVGEAIEDENLRKLGIQLIESLENFVGMAAIEFKIDSRDGLPKLLEINPRLWGYSRLAHASGINFHKMLVELALGEDVEEQHHYATDTLMVRHYDDRVYVRESLPENLR